MVQTHIWRFSGFGGNGDGAVWTLAQHVEHGERQTSHVLGADLGFHQPSQGEKVKIRLGTGDFAEV